MSASLFTPFSLRDTTFSNRLMLSPLCQYSADAGMANDWHRVHLGTRAAGGAGLVMTEAAAAERGHLIKAAPNAGSYPLSHARTKRDAL